MDHAAPRFAHTTAADGTLLTVIDSRTGLEWAAKPLPGRYTQPQAIEACKALDLAGHVDWSLPSREQLLSLVDITRYAPAIDTDAFPKITGGWFWTSDLAAWSESSAWSVYFYGGLVNYYHRLSSGFALAVRRAGQ